MNFLLLTHSRTWQGQAGVTRRWNLGILSVDYYSNYKVLFPKRSFSKIFSEALDTGGPTWEKQSNAGPRSRLQGHCKRALSTKRSPSMSFKPKSVASENEDLLNLFEECKRKGAIVQVDGQDRDGDRKDGLLEKDTLRPHKSKPRTRASESHTEDKRGNRALGRTRSRSLSPAPTAPPLRQEKSRPSDTLALVSPTGPKLKAQGPLSGKPQAPLSGKPQAPLSAPPVLHSNRSNERAPKDHQQKEVSSWRDWLRAVSQKFYFPRSLFNKAGG